MIWLYIIMCFLFVGCCCRARKKVDASTQTEKKVTFMAPAFKPEKHNNTNEDEVKWSSRREKRRQAKRNCK